MTATWHTPANWVDGEYPGGTKMNEQVRDNEEYLIGGRAFQQFVRDSGTNVTKTGVGSDVFAAIDTSNLRLTFTPQSTRVKLLFSGWIGVSAGTANVDWFSVNLATRASQQISGGAGTNGLYRVSVTTGQIVVCEAIFTGLTPNVAHSFDVYWKQSATANTMTWYQLNQPATYIRGEEF